MCSFQFNGGHYADNVAIFTRGGSKIQNERRIKRIEHIHSSFGAFSIGFHPLAWF